MDWEDILFGGIAGLFLSVFIGPFMKKKVDAPVLLANAMEKHVQKLEQEEAEKAQQVVA